jgi:hypothetical protein
LTSGGRRGEVEQRFRFAAGKSEVEEGTWKCRKGQCGAVPYKRGES